MTLSSAIAHVLAEYPKAMSGPLKDSPIAAYLRKDFPDEVRRTVNPLGEFLVEGSPGQGQWARSPWVAIFDPLITDTAQRGYYAVYLTREDFSGVYLSLNQGVTEVKDRYHTGAKNALVARGQDMRARMGTLPSGFSSAPIDLRPSSAENNSAFYEAGNICSVFYDAQSLPTDAKLEADIVSIVEAYARISDADPDLSSAAVDEDAPAGGSFDEDHTRFRAHRRVERNPMVSKRVKDAQGLICKACGFDFRKEYPGIKRNDYIEAHHLVPISLLKGQKIRRDPLTDFAVLCSNCHRMIHRSPEPWNLEGFRKSLLGRHD